MYDGLLNLLWFLGGITLIWFFVALIRAMLGVSTTQEKLDRVLKELQDLKQRAGPEQVKNDEDKDRGDAQSSNHSQSKS